LVLNFVRNDQYVESTKEYIASLEQLLTEIRDGIQQLNDENTDLRKENKRLREQLKKVHQGQSDIFSVLADKDRIALRRQIAGLIEKIDNHLEE
jgi:predicted  nucleic acid-binding Zn-ribbon protein